MEEDNYVPTYCGSSYTDLPMEVREIYLLIRIYVSKF